VFFEPYHQVLKAIQNISPERLPFSRYLVQSDVASAPPQYLVRRSTLDLSPIFSSKDGTSVKRVKVLEPWPEMTSTLDRSQLSALKCILTREVALVQGPPGTGKTFIGLAAGKILLQNKATVSPDAPILAVTLTNHGTTLPLLTPALSLIISFTLLLSS